MKKVFYILFLLIITFSSVFFVNAEETDSKSPEIINISTGDMQVLRDNFISFEIIDIDSGLSSSSVKFYINGEQCKNVSITLIESNKGVKVNLKDLSMLTQGKNILRVEAKDFKDNILDYKWTVFYGPEYPIVSLDYNSDVILGSTETIKLSIDPYAFRSLVLKIKYDVEQIKVESAEGTGNGGFYNKIDSITGELTIIINNQVDSEEAVELAIIKYIPLVKGEIKFDIVEFTYISVLALTSPINVGLDEINFNVVDDYDYYTFITAISLIDEDNVLSYLDLYRTAYNEYVKFNIDLITNTEVLSQVKKMEECIENYNQSISYLNKVNADSNKIESLIIGGNING